MRAVVLLSASPRARSLVLLKGIAGVVLQFRHFNFAVFDRRPFSAFKGFEKFLFVWIKDRFFHCRLPCIGIGIAIDTDFLNTEH